MRIDDCPFCMHNWGGLNVVDRNATGSIVAIKPLNPVTPGHLLVIHSNHTDSAADDPEQAGFLVAFAAKYVAKEGCDANIIVSVGPAASQTIEHTNVHIVPRTAGDGLMLPWTGQDKDQDPAEAQPKRKRRAS